MLDTPRSRFGELSVIKQRYRAVLEVAAGVPVTEVAGRELLTYGRAVVWLP